MLLLDAQQIPPKDDKETHIPRLEENNIRKAFF